VEGEVKIDLRHQGSPYRFESTLAYVDEEVGRRYREGLLSILKAYGCESTLEGLSYALDNTYRSSTKGEVRDLYDFWKLLLNSLGMSEN